MGECVTGRTSGRPISVRNALRFSRAGMQLIAKKRISSHEFRKSQVLLLSSSAPY